MKITLGSNIASLQAQRRLGEASDQISETFERLSSGMRINRASDDAAGLSIADALRADSRVATLALRNVNDAFSLVAIADAALEQQGSILFRLQELATQSANGVYSSEQRGALQTEYAALVSEFGRIGESTEFNSNLLLSGRSGGVESFVIQAGIDGSENSQISVDTVESGRLSGTLHMNDTEHGNDATAFSLEVFNLSSPTLLSLTKEEIAATFGDLMIEVTGDFAGEKRNVLLVVGAISSESLHLLEFEQSQTDPSLWENQIGVADSLKAFNGTGSMSPDGRLPVYNGVTDNGITYELDMRGLRISGFDATLGDLGNAESSSLDFTHIENVRASRTAIELIERRRQEIVNDRGGLGAMASRLDVAKSQVSAMFENFKAAESRIRDADIAADSASLTQLSILQQAASGVLAQANQQPALALRLLQQG